MNRALELMGIFFIAWLMIIAGSLMMWAIANFLVIHNTIIAGILKVTLSFTIIVIWAATWRRIAYGYFWRTIRKKKAD